MRAILLKPAAETTPGEIERVIGLAERTGALAAVQAHCAHLGREAQAALEALPDSPQKELLRAMAQYLVEERES